MIIMYKKDDKILSVHLLCILYSYFDCPARCNTSNHILDNDMILDQWQQTIVGTATIVCIIAITRNP